MDITIEKNVNPNTKISDLTVEQFNELFFGSPKKRLTIADVCARYSVTRQTVHNWMNSGKIPFVVVGGRPLFDVDVLDKDFEIKKGKHLKRGR